MSKNAWEDYGVRARATKQKPDGCVSGTWASGGHLPSAARATIRAWPSFRRLRPGSFSAS